MAQRRRRWSWPVSIGLLIALFAGGAPQRPARAATGREPVIVIPGVAGSELTLAADYALNVANGHGGSYARTYRAGERVWVNTWEAALLGDDDYFDILKLQPDGRTPVAPPLAVSGIYGPVYDDLIVYLERQGYARNVDLWLFPYDWRTDIRTTHEQLDALVGRALVAANGGRADPASWTITRVDLLGHSMGGLVGRSYVSDPARAGRVDQLITLGSPQLGAVKFLKTLLYGDTFGPYFLGIGLNPTEIKDVVQHMPGAVQLLPSRPYYTAYDNSDDARLRPYVEGRDVDGDGQARGVLAYDDVLGLLRNSGANSTVLGMADSYHTALDEGQHGGVNGVRWAALVGTGRGTVGQLREYTGTCWTWAGYRPCPKRDELPVDGDGTVAVMSAAMGDPWRNELIASGANLWYLAREHGALVQDDESLGVRVGDGPALTWIGRVLSGEIDTTAAPSLRPVVFFPAVSSPAADAKAAIPVPAAEPSQAPPPPLEGLWIAALGPAALEVRDGQGRGAGRARAQEETQPGIPGASYDRMPEGEFLFVPQGAPYTLRVAAEGEGSVDLKVRVLGNNRIERTAVYLGIPLGAGGQAELRLAADAGQAKATQLWPELAVDADGDGAAESTVPPVAVLDAQESADTDAPSISVLPVVLKSGGAVTVSWQQSDSGAGVFQELAVLDPGGAAARPVQSGETVTLPTGRHTLMVVVQDRAGNTSVSEVRFEV